MKFQQPPAWQCVVSVWFIHSLRIPQPLSLSWAFECWILTFDSNCQLVLNNWNKKHLQKWKWNDFFFFSGQCALLPSSLFLKLLNSIISQNTVDWKPKFNIPSFLIDRFEAHKMKKKKSETLIFFYFHFLLSHIIFETFFFFLHNMRARLWRERKKKMLLSSD